MGLVIISVPLQEMFNVNSVFGKVHNSLFPCGRYISQSRSKRELMLYLLTLIETAKFEVELHVGCCVNCNNSRFLVK